MCDKAFNTHSSTIQVVPNCFKTQEMCDEAFNKSFLAFIDILDRHKTQKMCNAFISEDLFSIYYVLDPYKIQQMCDDAVDDCLAALKFLPNWFVTSKMMKILFTAFHADENIPYFNEDSGNIVFGSTMDQ